MKGEKTYLDAFRALFGREPSDAERQRAFRLISALGLDETDDLAKAMMLMGYVMAMAERIPKQVQDAARVSMEEARATAERVIEASATEAKASLAAAVASVAQQVANDVASRARWRMIAIAAPVIAVVMGGIGSLAYLAGRDVGHAKAMAELKNEDINAVWANTTEGRRAKSLADNANISNFLECKLGGYAISQAQNGRHFCHPSGNTPGGYSWYLPN